MDELEEDIRFLESYRWCRHKRESDILVSQLYKKFQKRYLAGAKGERIISDRMKEFHDAFVILWEKIELGRIYSEGGSIYVQKGDNNRMLDKSLYEYLRGIMFYKQRECWKDSKDDKRSESLMADLFANYREDEHLRKELMEIMFDCLGDIRDLCRDILTMFYFEKMSYQKILPEVESATMSVDGLKAVKSRCMKTIRIMALDAYKNRNEEEF